MTISMSSASLSVVDTNVVVYAHDQGSPYHESSRNLLLSAQTGQAALCVTPQILAEFFAVVTSPKRVAHPRSPAETLDAIERILHLPGMTLLPIPADIVTRWVDLARRYPVTRQHIFDLQIVATMLGNGVRRLYTFNGDDFARFDEIQILSPQPA